jgi:hypothetical protein
MILIMMAILIENTLPPLYRPVPKRLKPAFSRQQIPGKPVSGNNPLNWLNLWKTPLVIVLMI